MTLTEILSFVAVTALGFWQWLNTRKADAALAAANADKGEVEAKREDFHFSKEVIDFYKDENSRLRKVVDEQQAKADEQTALLRRTQERLYKSEQELNALNRRLVELTGQHTYCLGWLCIDSDCGRRNPKNKAIKGVKFDAALAGVPADFLTHLPIQNDDTEKRLAGG